MADNNSAMAPEGSAAPPNGFQGGPPPGFGDPLAPAEGYEYDFEDSGLPMRTPFDGLIGLPGIDSIGDIFGAGGGDTDAGNPFAGNGAGGNPFGGVAGDQAGGNPFAGGGNPFAGMNSDTGEGNTDNGNGNGFAGDSNTSDGNGNWSFGDRNQVTGNGNWNLAGSDSVPFDLDLIGGGNLFAGGGNPAGGGGNPVFAGGGSEPAPAGGVPDAAGDPDANDNTTNGNGNWYFGSDNETNGNGNWNFGSGNSNEGNGNWNFGNGNDITGNGNRPTGDGSTVNGNGNKVEGNNNKVDGNRFNISEEGIEVFGNGDRYFSTDADGNTTLVNDESAGDPNMTFDFDSIVGQFPNSAPSFDIDSLTSPNGMAMPAEGGDNSAGGDADLNELIRQSPFGVLLDLPTINGAEDIFGNLGDMGGENPFGGGEGGSNPFSGGMSDGGAGGSNPWEGWDPLPDGKPFIVGDEPTVAM
ncbi:MAG: hypothetical protein WBB01_23550 [Phormidesmis sp.]